MIPAASHELSRPENELRTQRRRNRYVRNRVYERWRATITQRNSVVSSSTLARALSRTIESSLSFRCAIRSTKHLREMSIPALRRTVRAATAGSSRFGKRAKSDRPSCRPNTRKRQPRGGDRRDRRVALAPGRRRSTADRRSARPYRLPTTNTQPARAVPFRQTSEPGVSSTGAAATVARADRRSR